MTNPITRFLNRLAPDELGAALAKCCGSTAWVHKVASASPFDSDAQLLKLAEQTWRGLNTSDWLEALAAHPRIGDVDSLRAKYSGTRDWAAGEQSGVAGASEETIARLAELNAAYEERFGQLFIVCATGKSADEMLRLLVGRIDNPPDEELSIAAEEQLKITLLRLRKLPP